MDLKIKFLGLIIILSCTVTYSQLSITSGGTNYTINFDGTVTGVADGQFEGSGFTSTTVPGQLNSNAWASNGMSDGTLVFGGTQTSGDYARGISVGGVSTGGFYAFEVTSGNRALGIQPGADDWTDGDITLKVLNNTGGSIISMDIAYDIYVRNDEERSNSFNVSYSYDGITYLPVVSLDYTSPEVSTGPDWIINPRSTTLGQFNIAAGSYFYLRWSGDDVSGAGARDEFALDNISLTATATTNTIIYFTLSSLLINEGAGIVSIPVSIQNPSAAATQVDVVLTDNGYSPDINGFTSQTVVFPANSVADQYVNLSITNDVLIEGFENLQFDFQNISGGSFAFVGYPNNFTLSIADDELSNAWINELHYDDAGTDTVEFVEVVIENPDLYNLADFTVTLYNGSGGAAYDTKLLSEFTVGTADPNNTDMRYYYYEYQVNGIQNGPPDGICLDYAGNVLLFISYEGEFTATNGPAIGLSSTDILVLETSATVVFSSLGLSGVGTQYSDFTWVEYPNDATPGDPNSSQSLPVELTSFSAATIGSTVKLSWNTATEVNNYGFEIERNTPLNPLSRGEAEGRGVWEKIGFVNGYGNSNSPKSYSYEDKNVTAGKYSYRLKQIDNDGQFEYSKTIEVDLGAPKKFELSQNYPNPFNPGTTINYNLPEAGNVKLIIYNILGQEIRTLVNEFKEAGVHTINFNASELNSGLYIYKIEAGLFTQARKMTLVK